MKTFNKSSGYTLITVVFIVTILVILASIGLGIALTEVRLTKNQQGSVEALYAAETGANRALSYLDGDWKSAFEDGSSVPGFTETVIPGTPGQTYKVTVDVKKTGTVVRAVITSTGTSRGAKGEAKRNVQVTASKQMGGSSGWGPGDFMIYSGNNITWESLQVTSQFYLVKDDGDVWSDGDVHAEKLLRLIGPDLIPPSNPCTKDVSVKYINFYKGLGNSPVILGCINSDTHAASEKKSYPGPEISGYRDYVSNKLNVVAVSNIPSSLYPPSITLYPCVYSGSLPSPVPDCNIWLQNLPNVGGYNNSLVFSDGLSLTIKGNLYVEGNIVLKNNANITIQGSLVADGGLLLENGATINVQSVYLRGARPMFATYAKGSLVLNDSSKVKASGDVYVNGGVVYSESGTLYPGALESVNLQVDGTNNGSKPPITIGNNIKPSGSILVPNGDLVINSCSGTSFKDIKVGGKITIDDFFDSCTVGNVYTDKDLNIKASLSSKNLYSGGSITMNKCGMENISVSGVMAAVKDIKEDCVGGIGSFTLDSGGSVQPAGVFTGTNGNFKVTAGNFNFTGLIWTGGDVRIESGGSFTYITGSIRAVGNVTVKGLRVFFTYDKDIVNISKDSGLGGGPGPGPGPGPGGSLKIVDWRESF